MNRDGSIFLTGLIIVLLGVVAWKALEWLSPLIPAAWEWVG